MRGTSAFMAVILTIVASETLASGRLFFEPRKLTEEQQAKVDSAPLGSLEDPVRCESPSGERAYLARLRCPSGVSATYGRLGSVGLGPYETILDRYEVRCPDWSEPTHVYMDMYHESFQEKRAVPGFSILEPE